MAIRNIRHIGDNILTKTSKEVTKVTPRTKTLIADMFETMYAVEGMGLSAVQVGVLQRIFIVDPEGGEPRVLINPRLLETSGEQTDKEGCLSVPGKHGTVTRPAYVRVRAYDENMQPFEMEATELLARALCHELDHLDGKLYVDLVEGELCDNTEEENEE
jgi:peptide deformylase